MASRLIKLSCAVSVGFAAFSAPGLATECANKDEIVGLFTKWDAALQTGNPETVADLYAKDGVLLPTVSNKVRTDHAAIVDYFHHFLELKPKGTLNEIHITCLGDDTAINQGIYTFDVVKGGGNRLRCRLVTLTCITRKTVSGKSSAIILRRCPSRSRLSNFLVVVNGLGHPASRARLLSRRLGTTTNLHERFPLQSAKIVGRASDPVS